MNKSSFIRRASVIALSVSLLSSLPSFAFSWKADTALQPVVSVTTLRYDSGVLNIQAPVANVTPHWEIWDSRSDGQASRMIILDIPGLAAAHVPGFKRQLEEQSATIRLAHPEFLKVLVINTQPDTIRLMLEVASNPEQLPAPRLTVTASPVSNSQPGIVASLSNVRLYLAQLVKTDPLTGAVITSGVTISPLEKEISPNLAIVAKPAETPTLPTVGFEPAPVVGAAAPVSESASEPVDAPSVSHPAPETPKMEAAPQQLAAMPPQQTSATVAVVSDASAVQPEIRQPQSAPAQPVDVSYEMKLQSLEETLANVRKTLQGKEAAVTTLKQQQAKSQQELAQLKQQLQQKQTELTKLTQTPANASLKQAAPPAAAKPQASVPASSPQASTALFLELQKALREKETLAAQVRENKTSIQALQTEKNALQAKLAAASAPPAAQPQEESFHMMTVAPPVVTTPEPLTASEVKKLELEIELNPDRWLAYSKLAKHYQGQGLWDDAQRVLKNLVLLDPQNTDGLAQLAMVYAYKGEYDNAQKTLSALLSQFDRISDIPAGLYPDIVETQQRIILSTASK